MTSIKKLTAFAKWFFKSNYKEIILIAFFAFIADIVLFIAALISNPILALIGIGIYSIICAVFATLYMLKKEEIEELKQKDWTCSACITRNKAGNPYCEKSGESDLNWSFKCHQEKIQEVKK